jgi:WD40-like Beta Propeller Repeat
MTSSSSRVNPLFASSASRGPATDAPARRSAQVVSKVGGYGSVAVAAWLLTAVATGYGLSAADTTGASSDASSAGATSSASAGAQAGTSTAGPKKRRKGAKPVSPSVSSTSTNTESAATDGTASDKTGDTASDKTTSGATSSSSQVAPGVTIGSSGGGMRLRLPDLGQILGHPVKMPTPSVLASATPADTSVDAAAADTSEPVKASVATVVSALDAPAAQFRKSTSDTSAELKSAISESTKTAKASSLNAAATAPTITGVQNDIADTLKGLSTTVTKQVSEAESKVAATARAITTEASASVTTFMTAATPATPTAQIAQAGVGVVGFLNNVVTKLLNPFLNSAPQTPGPLAPIAWAVLGWVRRNLFNEAPTIKYDPTTTTQTEQTVTGYVGATDPEGDKLTYTVTQQPTNGTVTIDQATGEFTYTPKAIDYDGTQTDSFTVSATDGKTNLLSLFGQPHSAETTIGVTVQPPTATRTIVNLPDTVVNPWTPRYSSDGSTIYFAATPAVAGAAVPGARSEIYQMTAAGTDVQCLTCGVSPTIKANLFKPVPTADGSGRVLVQLDNNTSVILQKDASGNEEMLPIIAPTSGSPYTIAGLQEPRISPDGKHILFSQIALGQGGYIGEVPVVGTLTENAAGTAYVVGDARVVAAAGEGKNWTADGKSVIVLGGYDDQGNVDDISVDLATGVQTRVTGNLDYDEDIDESPNGQWIAVGSLRGQDALTPLSRVQRPDFLYPFDIGAVYTAYAIPTNISNQEWLVASADDLNGQNGIPLFVNDDGWTARSMPSFNEDGTAVTFWEYNVANPSEYRMVIANLQYTTSVGTVQGDLKTPSSDSWAPSLSTYTLSTPPLPPVGTYDGVGGGTAVVSEAPDPTQAGHTIRTVTYTNYVNKDGEILNGTESTNTTSSVSSVHYQADITVTGAHTGYLKGDATFNELQRTMTGYVTSDVDGNTLNLLDPSRLATSVANA